MSCDAELQQLAADYRDALVEMTQLYFEISKRMGEVVEESSEISLLALSKVSAEKVDLLLTACDRMPDMIACTAAIITRLCDRIGSMCIEEKERFFVTVWKASRTADAMKKLTEAGKESDDASATEEGTTGHPASAE